MKRSLLTTVVLFVALSCISTLCSCGGGGGSSEGVTAAEAGIDSLFEPTNVTAKNCTIEFSAFKDDSGNQFNIRFNCSSTGAITSCTLTAVPSEAGKSQENRTSSAAENYWNQGGQNLSNITFYREETSVPNQFKANIIIDLMRITNMNNDAEGKLLGFNATIQTARAFIVVPGITLYPTQFFITPGTNVTVTYN